MVGYKNPVAMLIALIVMLLIAAEFGYRLHIGMTGLTFERNDTFENRTR